LFCSLTEPGSLSSHFSQTLRIICCRYAYESRSEKLTFPSVPYPLKIIRQGSKSNNEAKLFTTSRLKERNTTFATYKTAYQIPEHWNLTARFIVLTHSLLVIFVDIRRYLKGRDLSSNPETDQALLRSWLSLPLSSYLGTFSQQRYLRTSAVQGFSSEHVMSQTYKG